jgi:hypothetical protein
MNNIPATKTYVLEAENVTLTGSGMFGYQSKFVKELRAYYGPYAQYPAALFLEYREPRKRNWRRRVVSGQYERAVVTQGDNTKALHQEPYEVAGSEVVRGEGVVLSKKSRWASCAVEWDVDFAKILASAKAAGVVVLLDSAGESL